MGQVEAGQHEKSEQNPLPEPAILEPVLIPGIDQLDTSISDSL